MNLDLNYKKTKVNSNFTIGFQGGSQGSEEINNLVYKICEDKRYLDVDIVHITGKNNAIANTSRINYFPHNYIHDMELFYNSIDLQVSRSGGGVLEAAYLDIFQLLIPFKHGTTSSHQRLNAEYLEKINAAKIIDNYDDLTNEIDNFIKSKNKKINKFKIEAGNSIISEILLDELIK